MIGLSLPQPVPTISGVGVKPIAHNPQSDFSSLSSLRQLEPRRPTTGDYLMPLSLKPELLISGEGRKNR